MSFIIREAQRIKSKLRLAISGVSNSGKTYSALLIAKGMGFDNKKTIVIDTESAGQKASRVEAYSHLMKFDVLLFPPPFSPQRYIEAIEMCEKGGYECIIIDSCSHEWNGIGGILELHQKAVATSSSKNSFSAWAQVTPLHNRFIDKITRSEAHIICTVRSKSEHIINDENGKKTIEKVGLGYVQRDMFEYEFAVMFNLDLKTHLFSVEKDITELFKGRNEIISEEIGKELLEWLEEGADISDVDMSIEATPDYLALKEIAEKEGIEGLKLAWARLDIGKKQFLESTKDGLKEIAIHSNANKSANHEDGFENKVVGGG